MFPYLPSGVSDQRAADGNRYFLPGNWETYPGNRPFPVPTDCLFDSGNLIAADGIRRRRGVMGRSAGRRAGIYHNSAFLDESVQFKMAESCS